MLFAYPSLIALHLVHFANALCYYPNGSVAPQDSPCRDDTAESTCCGQGYACLSNNMCMATGKEQQKDGATQLVRGSCTDKSWRSGDCPNFCADPEKDNTGGGTGVAVCRGTDKIFYCINSEKSDCDKEINVLIFQDSPSVVTTIGVSTPTSTSTTSTSTFSSTSFSTLGTTSRIPESSSPSSTHDITTVHTSQPANQETAGAAKNVNKSAGLSDSTKIGIGVGTGVGGLLLIFCIGLVIFFYRKSKNKSKPTEQPDMSTLPPRYTSGIQGGDSQIVYDPYKYLPSQDQNHWHHQPVYEVAGNSRQSRPYELHGSSGRL